MNFVLFSSLLHPNYIKIYDAVGKQDTHTHTSLWNQC